ncbi:MAG: CAAX prenyl protease-related protein [Armatimonadetes bacterium]|nr:CAAX prenyl protease-related protein [Armatimonadota bacterium]
MEGNRAPNKDWLPYVLPIALFLAITFAEGKAPEYYVWIYFAKIIVVVGALIWAKPTWRDIQYDPKLVVKSVVLGLILFAVWVGIEKYLNYPHMGDRSAYNPFEKIPDAGLRTAFIAVRFLGLVLVVPFMEELFWRSFFLRYASNSKFSSLPIGTHNEAGALIACLIFAGSHPEWISAFIFAVALTILVGRTKSIFACFVTHAATNLALGIYVMSTGSWHLW